MGTGMSVFGIPTILNGGAPSEVMVRQWRFQFDRGFTIIPVFGIINAVNYWTVAYRCYMRGLEWRGFAAAGLSTFFIIPFTVAFLKSTNDRLIAVAEKKKETSPSPSPSPLSEGSVRSLIKKWGDLNAVRAVVPLIGTGLAVWNFCL